MGLRPKRWGVRDPETGEDRGSIFACTLDCAQAAAEMEGLALGDFLGTDGVDDFTICAVGCLQ